MARNTKRTEPLGRDLTLAAIVDLPDGTFELPADPNQTRLLRLFIGGGTLFSVAVAIVLVVLIVRSEVLPLPIGMLLLVIFLAGDAFIWFLLKPPVLKADALEIRVVNPLYGRRMPRSEVALVFRCQHFSQGRAGANWNKAYVFATSGGLVGLSASASWFGDDGMTEFAGRLGVPVAGDFTTRVKDQVPSSR